MSAQVYHSRKHQVSQEKRDWLRYQMIQRDGTAVNCHWCSKPLQLDYDKYQDEDYATIEHLVRIADGGTDDLSNLTWACPKCNHTRHTS